MIVNIRPRINNKINVNANNNYAYEGSGMELVAISAAINPLSGINDALDHMNNAFDGIGAFFRSVGYWLNPVNLWHEMSNVFNSGSLDTPLIVGTILGGILMMGGATWPKKWIFWGWVIFWILRVVFA